MYIPARGQYVKRKSTCTDRKDDDITQGGKKQVTEYRDFLTHLFKKKKDLRDNGKMWENERKEKKKGEYTFVHIRWKRYFLKGS